MKTSLIHWDVTDENAVGESRHHRDKHNHLKLPIMARLRAILERLAPIGYQDESGFHYGEQKRRKSRI